MICEAFRVTNSALLAVQAARDLVVADTGLVNGPKRDEAGRSGTKLPNSNGCGRIVLLEADVHGDRSAESARCTAEGERNFVIVQDKVIALGGSAVDTSFRD